MNSAKLKLLQIIHGAFCASIFLFGTLFYFKNKETLYFSTSIDQGNVCYPLFPIIAIIVIAVGIFLFKKQLSAIDSLLPVNDKVMKYQNAFVTKSAFFEGAAIMNIAALSIAPNAIFLIVAGVVFLLLLISRPTRAGVIDALNLSDIESDEL